MPKSSKTLYFDVLECLANKGIGIDVNIKKVCRKYIIIIPDKEKTPTEILGVGIDKMMSDLNSIESLGYIKYSKNHKDPSQLYVVGGNFSASITKEGLDYYYSHLLKEATLSSLKNQFWYNITTWVISLLSIATTIYTINQNTALSKKVQQISEEVQRLKSLQHLGAATHKTVDTILKTKKPISYFVIYIIFLLPLRSMTIKSCFL